MATSNASNDFSLEGKSALVVGAEHAVGRAAAVALAEAGAKVVLASQEPGTDKQLKEVAKLVNAAGTKAVVRVQDAATRADVVLAGGTFAADTARGVRTNGGTVVRYDSNDEAIAWLRANVRRGDAILLKGSRKYKMEQIAEALGAEVFA